LRFVVIRTPPLQHARYCQRPGQVTADPPRRLRCAEWNRRGAANVYESSH
jgi:hypothetical protein